MSIRRIRVIDLETAGDAATDVCEIGWQDVVSVDGNPWALSDERAARFVNPGKPISAETMSIHHILDEWVAGAPFWKEMAAEILQPDGGVIALSAHRAAFEQRYCTPRFTGGADWICTWKCALRLWPDLKGFSNQMLRYQRMPAGLIHELGLPAHRAMPDAYVTAHHLRDMLNEVGPEQLIRWSREPGLLPRVRSGPERGKPWSMLDEHALEELSRDRDLDTRFSATTELKRRGERAEPKPIAPAQQDLF
ncbi:exonuclease [Devosia soli]|uniref:Exonuclease n=1 Tax=Devosia soli TaxID=361041 RepID=A0A0F5L2U2_9HYPH|nr:DNA polymerase III subunit epsilon [Devosia soli]KKB76515.1 exonuclease [Devosia soli]